MTFTDKTFEALAPYERHFNTAINGDWCSNPGRDALDLMHAELDRIDNRTTRMNYNCSTCVLTVVKRIGRLYFADKAERDAQKAAKALADTAAALGDKDAKKVTKPSKAGKK